MTKSRLLRISLIVGAGLAIVLMIREITKPTEKATGPVLLWPVQSIDTMKFSRDLAREKMSDQVFDSVIEEQVARIAGAGATHVAVGTPYDPEFTPFLRRWVDAARRHDLNVWYRGNLSGWEEWFSYPPIDPSGHKEGIRRFVTDNPDLFLDQDIFDPCPECEQGFIGDPRFNGRLEDHRQFLVEEYEMLAEAFADLDRQVSIYFSMNGDVARLVMDEPTTRALGGAVTVDHYVAEPQKLADDLVALAQSSGGKVVLGEFGAPIPDIHGDMTEQQQQAWINQTLDAIARTDVVRGINYWVAVGGSTEIWSSEQNIARTAVVAISQYFQPAVIAGNVADSLNRPVRNAKIITPHHQAVTNSFGDFSVPIVGATTVTVSGRYDSQEVIFHPGVGSYTLVLPGEKRSFWDRVLDVWQSIEP